MTQHKAATLTASEAAEHYKAAQAQKENIARFEADTGRTLGNYPNAANIREWMRRYFGRDAMNTDLGFTLLCARGQLPEIATAADAIRFGLARGFSITDRGRDKAYDLGILSDDSPAVPIPVGASPKVDTPAASDTMQRLTPDDYYLIFDKLDFPQKTLIAELIQDAEFDYYNPSCLSKKVIDSLECFRLMSDFTGTDLVEWAIEKRLKLTAAGLAVWKDIQANIPAASARGKAKAADTSPKAGGMNIADTIGATAWGEIEIQMSGTGIRARKAGTDKWHPARGWIAWNKLGMVQSQNIRYFAIFTAIAKAGGAIPKEGGRDYNSVVNDLNDKMRAAFGIEGQAFKTEGATTKSMFADISVKR